MKNYLVSIIVPIYKVEDYLVECIESIVNQTYKNLEIILVDDGSPDKCPEICDMYAKKDNRIIVIHQENGGVSSARNIGLEKASGDFIYWVDADDYIDLKFVEDCIEAINENPQIGIICIPYKSVKNGDVKQLEYRLKNDIYNSRECLENILSGGLDIGPHSHLARANIWKSIIFPLNMFMEDLAVTYKLYLNETKVFSLKTSFYYYRYRETSTMNGNNQIKNKVDLYKARKMRYDYLLEHYSQYADLCRPVYYETMCFLYDKKNQILEQGYKEDLYTEVCNMRDQHYQMYKKGKYSIAKKFMAILAYKHFDMYLFVKKVETKIKIMLRKG